MFEIDDLNTMLGVTEEQEKEKIIIPVPAGIKPMNILPEDTEDFASLSDADEIKRGRNHVKRAMEGGYRPIPPREWMVCPLCVLQIELSGMTNTGATRPYRAPESLVTHYKSHGGVMEVARQLNVLPEQLPMNNELLRARFREIGIKGGKKNG